MPRSGWRSLDEALGSRNGGVTPIDDRFNGAALFSRLKIYQGDREVEPKQSAVNGIPTLVYSEMLGTKILHRHQQSQPPRKLSPLTTSHNHSG
jgi:hypothetical protein